MVYLCLRRSFFRNTMVLVALAAMLAVCWAPYVYAAAPLKVGIGSNPILYNTSATLELKANPTQYDYALLKIEGGKLPFTISMSNPILEIKQIGQGSYREYDWVDYRLYPRRAGTAVVTVKDSTGQTLTRQITVYDPSTLPLKLGVLPGASDPVAVGQGRNFQVSNGKAPYKVVSANSGIARVEAHGAVGTYSIWGVAAGSTQITVTDANGAKVEGIVYVSMTKPLSFRVSDTMLQDGKNEIIIDSGNPPYLFSVTTQLNATITPGGTDSSNRPIYWLVAKSPGKGLVTVRDAKGQFQNKPITVLEYVNLSFPQLPASSPTLYIGEKTQLTVTGGIAPYSVSSDKPTVITQQGVGQYTVSASQVGSVAFTVKDSKGATRSKSLSVRVLEPLKLTMLDKTLTIGTNGDFLITGGVAPITVTASGNQVRLTKVNDKSYTVTPKLPGQATITAKDSKGQTTQVLVTVASPPPLAIDPAANQSPLNVGATRSMTITGGVAPYTVKVSNSNVKAVLEQNTAAYSRYKLTGSAPGTADILVNDSIGASASVRLTVQAVQTAQATQPLSGQPSAQANQQLQVSLTATKIQKTEELIITGGTPPYSFGYPGIVTIKKIAEGKLEVIPKKIGTGTISVMDKKGLRRSIKFTVASPPLQIVAPKMLIIPATGKQPKAEMLTISGGIAPYQVTVIGSGIVAKQVSTTQYELRAPNASGGLVKVVDSVGQSKLVSIPVYPSPELTFEKNSIAVGEQTILSIKGGLGPYTVTISNRAAVTGVWRTQSSIAGKIRFTGIAPGAVDISIRDSRGATSTIRLTVVKR